jgi:hypothetical protein
MKIEKSKKYLVIYNDNWADEMDISGFFTCHGEYLLDVKKKLYAHKEEVEIFIGTNEEVTFSNGKDLWKRLEIKEISESESAVLSKLFSNEDEYKDKDHFDNYIYELTHNSFEPMPEYSASEYSAQSEYAEKLKDWAKNRDKIIEKLGKENKPNFDEIVKSEKLKQKIQDDRYTISQFFESQGIEFDTEEDIDAKIESLTDIEKEEILEKSKILNRLNEVEFGFSDIIDQFLENIEDEEDYED